MSIQNIKSENETVMTSLRLSRMLKKRIHNHCLNFSQLVTKLVTEYLDRLEKGDTNEE